MNDEIQQYIMKWTRRREFLARHVPACPNCGEKEQIQLCDWLNDFAKWKCRYCRHKWDYEPPEPPER